VQHRRIHELKLGGKVERRKVERRRCEPSRGAEGAKGGEVWGGGVPSTQGEGSAEEAVSPFQNFFEILGSIKMAYFRGLLESWC